MFAGLLAIPMIGKVIGIATNPIVMTIGAVVAALVFIQYQRNDAADAARSECRAAELAEDLRDQQIVMAELQRRFDALKKVQAESEAESDRDEAEIDRLKGERDAAVKLAGVGECKIPPVALDSVRNIR
jgi:hypothetical protein